jgi:methylenetetrahydrofolate dehydrogenase (NADP+) / methenyltetrahydrofolate cyclohydrolase
MNAKLIDGKKISRNIKDKVAFEVDKLSDKTGMNPSVTTIKIGKDSSSDLYLRLRDKACEKAGISSFHKFFSKDVKESEILDTVYSLNENSDVHGIMIQLPIPVDHISSSKIINAIDPEKDVEGLHPFNIGKTLLGEENLVPCTPLAVIKILEHEKIKLKGKNVVIVNHSEVVGKPLSCLFLNRDSTVSVCHVYTKNLKSFTKNADVLVSAAGVKNLIKKDMVNSDCFVLDVGIIPTDEGVTGDVCFDEVSKVVDRITPVPGGVGPVTVACSLLNMVKTFKNCYNGV